MIFLCVFCVCAVYRACGFRIPKENSVVARNHPCPAHVGLGGIAHYPLISTPPPAPRPAHPRSLYSLSHTPRDALRSSPRHSHAFVRPCGRCASSLAPHQSVPASRSRALALQNAHSKSRRLDPHSRTRTSAHSRGSLTHSFGGRTTGGPASFTTRRATTAATSSTQHILASSALRSPLTSARRGWCGRRRCCRRRRCRRCPRA